MTKSANNFSQNIRRSTYEKNVKKGDPSQGLTLEEIG